MKSNINIFLVLVAIILGIVALAKTSSLKSENEHLKGKLESMNKAGSKEHIELAVYMSYIQTHFSKLYFAGKANNLPLSKFYVHEINESFETIVDANVVDEGHNISALAKQFGEGPFHRFEKTIEEKGLANFENIYSDLINNCNGCHLTTEHSYINIVVPVDPPVGNQNYNFTGQ